MLCYLNNFVLSSGVSDCSSLYISVDVTTVDTNIIFVHTKCISAQKLQSRLQRVRESLTNQNAPWKWENRAIDQCTSWLSGDPGGSQGLGLCRHVEMLHYGGAHFATRHPLRRQSRAGGESLQEAKIRHQGNRRNYGQLLICHVEPTWRKDCQT